MEYFYAKFTKSSGKVSSCKEKVELHSSDCREDPAAMRCERRSRITWRSASSSSARHHYRFLQTHRKARDHWLEEEQSSLTFPCLDWVYDQLEKVQFEKTQNTFCQSSPDINSNYSPQQECCSGFLELASYQDTVLTKFSLLHSKRKSWGINKHLIRMRRSREILNILRFSGWSKILKKNLLWYQVLWYMEAIL